MVPPCPDGVSVRVALPGGRWQNRRMPFSREAQFEAADHDDLVAGAGPGAPAEPAWRVRALRRSLEPARARSVERLERFVRAARDLANESGSASFTVPQLAARAGLSLKTFYRCFPGKDELLLALLEDDSRLGARLLADAVDAHAAPEARLRAYVDAIFAMVALPGAAGYAGVLVREHRRLSEDHPEELRGALAPMVELLAREIQSAVDAGLARATDPARDAETIFALLLSGIHDVTCGRGDAHELAAYLWRFSWSGLRGDDERDDTPGG
jgi:AcrR family transcriptional regulator